MKWRQLRGIGLGVCIGALVAWTFVAQANDTNNLRQILPFDAKALWLMKQARAILETYHVDGESPVSEDVLVQGALRGMVSAWDDPYTRYADPDQLREEEIDMEGEYGGLGIYIGRREGRTVVISPIEDTPADRVGLKPGDIIAKIGEENIADWDQNKVVQHLRGEPGTAVTVWIAREGESELLRFDIVREKIEIKAVRSEMLSGDVGYVRLAHFNQKAAEELEKAFENLEIQGAQGYILDLRNNPGGLLQAAVDISDMFLEDGLIVGMKGRVAKANEEVYAERGSISDAPLNVLINEGSASASEIVAGALKDHHRGKVMGEKSFGKGSVQTLFPLPDGSGVYVTIARYYTPSGFFIDHVGLEPEVVLSGDISRVYSEDLQLQEAHKDMRAILLTLPKF
ncbi:MAG TPA: S41 family peptidase [Synergistaceae bacterium]|nr:S41 family peptidase [Synergistaceae bacterium]HPQ37279.1 S41 family peptidase [Synergistaceae bacterium]